MSDSKNGFMTSIWGPMLWSVLHMISLNYPLNPTKQDKVYYYTFIQSLAHVLPCGSCRRNMQKTLRQLPITFHYSLKNRKNFAKWVFLFHEEVNKSIGNDKPSNPTFEDMQQIYELFRANCNHSQQGVDNGCVVPLNILKSKCVLQIVPQQSIIKGIQIDKQCFPS